jgi:RimJ/RimL family protein N-acetyltransferase
MSFVPDSFEPPLRLVAEGLELEPLGPQHNDADHAAWSSSIEHIRATPGYPDGTWPRPMTPEENRRDLERHAADFAARRGFTYTVLEDGRIVGCVYIYPLRDGSADVQVKSWMTADRAELDGTLRTAVRAWLRDAWPFERVDYAG